MKRQNSADRSSLRRSLSTDDLGPNGSSEELDCEGGSTKTFHSFDDTLSDRETVDRQHIPTLPIYTQQKTTKNCWSVTPLDRFVVRSANYLTTKSKVPSQPYLLTARGADLLVCDPKKKNTMEDDVQGLLNGTIRDVPTLAIFFAFPWGSMNCYFEIPSHLAVYMQQDNSPTTSSVNNNDNNRQQLSIAERTLVDWLVGDTDYRNQRLKLIPYVAHGPWVVRNMVTGRPALIGQKLPVSYVLYNDDSTKAPLLTATLDVGSSSATAKRIVSVCKRYMSALSVDLGWVIEGQDERQLPEQMLGSIRLHHPDPKGAPHL